MHFLILNSSLATAPMLTEWLSTAPALHNLTCLRDPPSPLLDHLRALAPFEVSQDQPLRRDCVTSSARHLSPRLQAVQTQLLQGTPNKVMARELGLSDHTVKEYVSAVLAHHGVRNRLELVLRARDNTGSHLGHWPSAAS